jgi:branched-chain amino acid transport system substrate-binding protein
MVIAVVVVLAIVGIVWAMSRNKTQTKTAAVRTVKIGVIAPLTGDGASYGEVEQHGIELAQRDFGGSNVTFQLLVRDTQCDTTKTVAAAKELVTAGVVAIIGDTCSGPTLAALPIVNDHKVVMISPGASSPELSVANDFFFRTYPTDSHQGVFTSQLMYKRGIRKLAIIYSDETYGKGLSAVTSDSFKKLGGTVVTSQIFGRTDTSFNTQLQAIKALNPDAMYMISNSASTGAAIVTQAKQIGITAPLYTAEALKDVNFLKDVDVAGNGMTVMAVTNGNRSFIDEYKATYDSEPTDPTGAQAYDAFIALAKVIKDGANTGDQIRLALPKTDFQGKSGEIKFDQYGDLAGGSYLIFTITNGQFVLTNE